MKRFKNLVIEVLISKLSIFYLLKLLRVLKKNKLM